MAGFNSSDGFGNTGGGFGTGNSFGGGGNFGGPDSAGRGFAGGTNNRGFNTGGGYNSANEGYYGAGSSFGDDSNRYFGGGTEPGSTGNGSFYESLPNPSGKRRMYLPALIISIIYGALWFFLGEMLVNSLFNKVWNPLAVSVYVVLFLLPLAMLLLLLSRASGNLDMTLKNWGIGRAVGLFGLCFLLTFMGTFILEFLYELEGTAWSNGPTSYVFVIDDSGSMSRNDPSMLRADAIGEIMRETDIPYCVYKFSEDAELIREMGKYIDGESYDFQSDGEATDILGALYTVAQEMKDSGFEGGTNPKVLLLSDGESYEDTLEETMKEFTDNNISISTVGFGDVNKSLMDKVAQVTGGVFVNCEDLSSLTQDMHEAIVSYTTRTLLTPRYAARNNVLYIILRIIFLTAIGALIGLTKARGAVSVSDYMRIFVFTLAQGFVAAVLCEILVNSFEGIARFLVDVLWAATVLTQSNNSPAFPVAQNGTMNVSDQMKNQRGNTKTVGNNGEWNNTGSGNNAWVNSGGNNVENNNNTGNGGWAAPGVGNAWNYSPTDNGKWANPGNSNAWNNAGNGNSGWPNAGNGSSWNNPNNSDGWARR